MIDTHCHLVDDAFREDRDEVIARATSAGVEAILVVGETFDENRAILELCREHPLLHACAGHYPAHLDRTMAENSLNLIREHAARLAGIGEVGLDYRIHESRDEREKQQEILIEFARLSNETGLPLSVHSRSAGHYTIDLLRAEGARHVVMHAFDGRAGHALRGVEAGYYFSIPPSVVRSRQKQKLVAALPLSRLLLESDAPVLGPDPRARNEPKSIVYSLAKIAEIKNSDPAEVAATTTANAKHLFRLP